MSTLQIGKTVPPSAIYRRLALFAALWVGAYFTNEHLWDWLLWDVLKLDQTNRWSEVAHFFLLDSIKISLLITGITFVVSWLRTYLTVERTRSWLGGKRTGVGNVLAAGLGVLTPFCSCSAVPAFIGFVSAGVPVGVTMSFLIASPLVNEVAIGLLAAWFGWKIAAIYAVSGFLIAVLSGLVISRFPTDRWVEGFVFENAGDSVSGYQRRVRLQDRLDSANSEVRKIITKVWPYLLVGIGIGAAIHGWAPTEFFTTYAHADNPLGVLVAVVVGIPLYSNAAGALPIVQVLADQGVPTGTLLAFMMSVVGLSLPELVLLRRVLKPQLLLVFVGIVGSGIIMIGYLFNLLLV